MGVLAQPRGRPRGAGRRLRADPLPLTLFAAAALPPRPRLQRYDFLSTGVGAMAVTGYCYVRGQDAGTALAITLVSTVVALVANELMSDAAASE